ncbi:MAG: hypothetical protein HY329_05105 [Chloroflexi bacterium]|nr:hypothetical protein [Chloroflexota bacterium]
MDVEWLILADAAQVVGGKLYLLGGGWERIAVSAPFPIQQPCAIATAFAVPWNETNQRRHVTIEIEDEDGLVIANVGGDVEVGRPPGIPTGQMQRIQLAANFVLGLQKPGSYRIVASIDGERKRDTTFSVLAWQGG